MRRLTQLDDALQMLNAGRVAPQVGSVDRLKRIQALDDQLNLQRSFVDDGFDFFGGGGRSYERNVFDELRDDELLREVAGPVNGAARRVTLDTPVEALSPMEIKAQQATQAIINNKLAQLGIGALATGGTAALINAQQGDDNGNVLINPVTGTVVGTGVAAGMGGLTGYALSSGPSGQMMKEMQADYRRTPGRGYQRDENYVRQYGKKNNRKQRQRSVRGGLRGAAVGAGSVALLQLMNALRDERPQSDVYI